MCVGGWGAVRNLTPDQLPLTKSNVVNLLRLQDGSVAKGDRVVAASTGEDYEVQEVRGGRGHREREGKVGEMEGDGRERGKGKGSWGAEWGKDRARWVKRKGRKRGRAMARAKEEGEGGGEWGKSASGGKVHQALDIHHCNAVASGTQPPLSACMTKWGKWGLI